MWQVFAFLNAITMSLANLFTKLSSGKLNPLLGALIAQVTAVFFILLFFLFSGRGVEGTKQGIIFAGLVGLMTAIGFTAWFKMFASGAPLVIGGTLAIMGVIVFTAVLGIVLLGEKVSLPVILGFLLALLSAWLLTQR